MDSDSSYYEPTYSADERIEAAIREQRRLEEQQAKKENLARKRFFENLPDSSLPVLTLPGLEFLALRHTKIKFSFYPATISNFVNKNVRFYVSLKYTDKHWRMKRDSLPSNYKWKVYRLFYDKEFFTVDDENIFSVIEKIRGILVVWTQKEEKFRLEKFERYKKGEDVELDSDDEQLFLSQDERIDLYKKRMKVLRRMVPPNT